MGKSLKQMLSYDGDVQEAMDLTFAVEYEYFGAIRAYELKPGGKDIPVTKENREGATGSAPTNVCALVPGHSKTSCPIASLPHQSTSASMWTTR